MTKDDKDKELLTKWLENFKQSETYCTKFFDKAKENYMLYKSYQEGSDKPYKHNIFVPYSFAYMEDSVAYYMLSILASPITFSIEPRFTAVSYELCMMLEAAVHFVLTEEQTEFVLELEDLIKNINISNVAYLVNYPIIGKREKIDDKGNKIEENYFERLHLDAPSTLDVFPEPYTKRLSRSGWIIKKAKESLETLKEWEKKGEYKNVKDVGSGTITEEGVKEFLEEIGLADDTGYDEDSKKIEILDCMFDHNVVTIGGRQAVIRDTTKDIIKPFHFDTPMLDARLGGAPGEWFGVGLLESIKPTQKELNLLRSQRRENISLILNKLFKFDILLGEIDLNTLFSAPGNVITGSGINEALQEFPMQDVTASSFKEEQSLIYDLQNISSMWDYARGGTPRRRETATGIIRLQQAAQSRNEWLLRKLDAYVLQPLCRRILVYLREEMKKGDMIEIIGEQRADTVREFYDLDPEDVKRMFKIMPLTESIVSIKEMNQNQFLQAFDRLIQLPDINRPALIKQLLQKLGQKDVKQILPELSAAGQEGLVAGVNQARQAPPGPPGMPGPPVAGLGAL